MKLSERWLREWVDPPQDVAAIREILTLGGLEVEDIAAAGPALDGVIVGEVQAVETHPDAAHLRVCRVFDGVAVRQVVCGAPNVQASMKTALAVPGARLGDGRALERAVIRGVESWGMLCSAAELGLGDDATGVIDLPDTAAAGAPVREVLALDDQVIDVNLTPNRGDCFSVIGIARDLGALTGTPMRQPQVAPIAPLTAQRFAVVLSDPGCPRYAGRVISGIDPAARTPVWLRERLRRVDVRSVHPVVDVTNYVMLELGQPMHAFDLDWLATPIVVRGARQGERLRLLDGQDIALDEGSLVITDGAGPVALAGIIGGESTAVSASTRNVFLESAFFEPIKLASAARRYRLHTDASMRFERGVDPTMQARAIERATGLIVEICGGLPGPCEVAAATACVPAAVEFRPAAVERLLGTRIDEQRMARIFDLLEMQVRSQGATWQVTPPPFRFDIATETDLIEEIARVHGYDAIPLTLPRGPGRPALPVATSTVERSTRLCLSSRGYFEAITYSFIDPELARTFDPESASVALANPISSEMSVLRRSLWPGLVSAAQHNLNRQHEDVRLFEIGMVFHAGNGDLVQANRVAGLRGGCAQPQQWAEAPRDTDFFDLKQDVEAFLRSMGQVDTAIVAATHHALHPGQAAAIVRDGSTLGWLGALHPAILNRLDLPKPMFLFEFDFDTLSASAAPQYQPISKFPAVRRDISIVVADEIPAAKCIAVAREAAGSLLRDLQLFDVYRGQGIDSGKKSLTLGLIFQALSSTLTDDEVEKAVRRVLGLLHERVGGTLRK